MILEINIKWKQNIFIMRDEVTWPKRRINWRWTLYTVYNTIPGFLVTRTIPGVQSRSTQGIFVLSFGFLFYLMYWIRRRIITVYLHTEPELSFLFSHLHFRINFPKEIASTRSHVLRGDSFFFSGALETEHYLLIIRVEVVNTDVSIKWKCTLIDDNYWDNVNT